MNKITIYYPSSLERFSAPDAFEVLKAKGQFEVFLEFIDPRTDCLVQKTFTFFPKPQVTTMGRCFIAEHNGLILRIPSDMEWWEAHSDGLPVQVRQKVTLLVQGEFKGVEFDLRVSPSIRVAV